MKAVEFIAKFGWDASVAKLDVLQIVEDLGDPMSGQELALRRYVDTYETIQNLGGIQAAKDAAYQNTMNVDGFDPSKIETAIVLVEEVEKFKGVA